MRTSPTSPTLPLRALRATMIPPSGCIASGRAPSCRFTVETPMWVPRAGAKLAPGRALWRGWRLLIDTSVGADGAVMQIVTRCESVEEFIDQFAALTTETYIVVPALPQASEGGSARVP